MAQDEIMTSPCSLILPGQLHTQLQRHLFPGDGDEHGAVIAAGLVETERGVRLLARSLHIALDGVDYVPGTRGYRMLTAPFVRDRVVGCREERLVYLAVHNHGGADSVAFSGDDLRSHERGYPALLDIARGMPVGALVFAQDAVAGDIWLPNGQRLPLGGARILGPSWRWIGPEPFRHPDTTELMYHRQTLLLGHVGQWLLSQLKVAVIGAGGVGSLLVEFLARLGVGHIVVVDPDRIDITNLPRLVGSRPFDALSWLTREGRPEWLRRIGKRVAIPKVKFAGRIAQRANSRVRLEAIFGNFLDADVARRFIDCDYLFLAADPMPVRLLFNAMVHQYLIPGVQVGAKARANKETGEILDVYSVSRPITPDGGCLWCNGLIPPGKLQEDAQGEDERRRQRYVDDPNVAAPSVMTLNATAAAQAANDFLFTITGLAATDASGDYVRFLPRTRDRVLDQPRADHNCSECGSTPGSRRGRGDSGPRLPTWH